MGVWPILREACVVSALVGRRPPLKIWPTRGLHPINFTGGKLDWGMGLRGPGKREIPARELNISAALHVAALDIFPLAEGRLQRQKWRESA
jgi:hypothetical protein